MTRRRSPGRRAPLLFVFLGLIGMACGGAEGPELAPVSGTVTYKGKPVTEGIVSFQPAGPDGAPATGTIGADGSYSLQTGPDEGARLGEYRVAVSARDEPDTPPDTAAPPLKAMPKVKSQLPLKYEDPGTSTLTRTVKSGRNAINFELD